MIKTEKQNDLAKRSNSATLFRLDSLEERTKEIVPVKFRKMLIKYHCKYKKYIYIHSQTIIAIIHLITTI